MKLIFIFLTFSSSLIYSAYEIDFNNFKKLPKVLELEIFSYISDELKPVFELEISDQAFNNLYSKIFYSLRFKRRRYIFYQRQFVHCGSNEPAGKRVEVYDTQTNDLKYEFWNDWNEPLDISNNGRYAVMGYWGYARVLDLENWRFIKYTLEHSRASLRSIVISQDDKYIVTGSHDRSVKIWELETGILKHTLKDNLKCDYLNKIMLALISPNCRYVIIVAYDNKIQLWDLETNSIKNTFDLNSTIESIAISQDNKYIMASCADKTLKIWNLETRDLKYTLYFDNIVKRINANGEYIYVTFDNGNVNLYTLSGEQTRIIKSLNTDQLNLVLDLLKLNKTIGKNIVTLSEKQGNIFITLPIIIKAALKRKCNLRYKTVGEFVYFV